MVEEALRWMKKAESDLKHAKSSLSLKDYDWVELASQQASEKGLKAVCISKGFGLIKMHDLILLCRKLNAPREVMEASGILNSFYASARYPDAEDLLDPKLSELAAKDALQSAEKIVKWCKLQIKI